MKFGARNQVVGVVTGVKKGEVMSLVKVRIPVECDLASAMTTESLAELGLKKGDQVVVLVKAVNVLLGKE
ncbi:MAG: TOBE domain-containing protein [Planctomycetes bacterium]|nr:TOBE domain-containing protein [Planctomycetota bacterium]